MTQAQHLAVSEFVRQEKQQMHTANLKKLDALSLPDIVGCEQLLLARTQRYMTTAEIVRRLIELNLLSDEQVIFDALLKRIATFLCRQLEGGRESATAGIDLEFDRDGVRYLVVVKSGPGWGTNSQTNQMQESFQAIHREHYATGTNLPVHFINGCCYGIDDQPHKGGYDKLCGQRFWTFLTQESDFYPTFIVPLREDSWLFSAAYQDLFARKLNVLVKKFSTQYVNAQGMINWRTIFYENLWSQTQ
jgi:hypothetical protein